MRNGRNERERLGLSLAQVYKATDIDNGHLSRWERGLTELGTGHLQQLAALYGCTLEDLLRDVAPPEEASGPVSVESEART